jgi:hypothetical protein
MTAWGANWLGPDRLPVQLLLVGLMFASLLMSVAIAEAIADLNAVVAVALEAADAIFLTVLGTLVYQHSAERRVPLFHVLYLCAGSRLSLGDSPAARPSDYVLSVTSFSSGLGAIRARWTSPAAAQAALPFPTCRANRQLPPLGSIPAAWWSRVRDLPCAVAIE